MNDQELDLRDVSEPTRPRTIFEALERIPAGMAIKVIFPGDCRSELMRFLNKKPGDYIWDDVDGVSGAAAVRVKRVAAPLDEGCCGICGSG